MRNILAAEVSEAGRRRQAYMEVFMASSADKYEHVLCLSMSNYHRE